VQALGLARRGRFDEGTKLLDCGLGKLSAARYGVFHAILPAQFAMCLADAGRIQQAIAVFEGAKIDLDNENQLHAPELLRVRGELALRSNEGLAVARRYFLRAIELSQMQGSPSWTLRAATSLAIAEKSDARIEAARQTLRAICAKFRDGADTFDLRLATQVLKGSYSPGHVVSAESLVQTRFSIDT
jgi:hypothetical protein